jgi:hypothetical protein
MQYQLVADGDIEEVSPVPNQRSTAQRLFRLIAPSALARYLAYNLNLLDRFVAVANPTVVSFEALEVDRPLVETVTAYSLQEYGAVAQRAGGRLLVVIDADRRQLYGETVSSGIDYQIYNNIVEAVTNDLKIPLLDLTTPFTSDYEMNHIQFESEKDYHWNEYGHNLVGKTIVNFLLDNQWLD